MEKKFEQIINEGKKNGKKISEINAELKDAGATFHLDYTMTPDGPQTGWSEQEMKEGFIPAKESAKDVKRGLDMSRKTEFAGTKQIQWLAGNQFEVEYDADGYAKKAYKVNK